ncbi:MAG: [FeFe] hydrogenase H-cluster maturation GTPase HydF [Desulfovibrio sp.]|nr:[FeFe] hydrogenase H-cluster maturation GTPase HydF [Desulfovibrio sp.]
MSLNETPSGERPHIAFFGKTNVGKSSLINAVTNQDLAIVSSVRGTTTDPVQKAMEILPLGPVLLIDTAGIDDQSILGEARMAKTEAVLAKTDLAVLVREAGTDLSEEERSILSRITGNGIPFLTVFNKADVLSDERLSEEQRKADDKTLFVSARDKKNIDTLRLKMAALLQTEDACSPVLVRDLVPKGGVAVLVVPIDSAAPKGRLILPQQQAIRDLLEGHAMSLVTDVDELPGALDLLTPSLVICDSQVFDRVSAMTPASIPLTSFSILMARYKGYLSEATEGLSALERLTDGSRILMAEGCTHHRQCEDIGTVKIPRWLKAHTGKDLVFDASSGGSFPENLTDYDLVVLCGGCMLNARAMQARMRRAREAGVPVTNYGILIAAMRGILSRATSCLTQGIPCSK